MMSNNNFDQLLTNYMRQHGLSDKDKKVTGREIQAYRYRHHSFCGFTTKETAFIMGVTPRQVCNLLQKLEKKCPQLFPVLTKQQAEIRFLITELGYTYEQVGQKLLMQEETVASIVNTLKKKGVWLNKRVRMHKRYDTFINGKWVNLEDMDNEDKIVEKY